MAWSAPRTWTTGELVTAAFMNGIRDTLLETAAAKVTTAGDTVYATGPNALARRAIGTAGQVLTVAGGLPTWASAPVLGVVTTAGDLVYGTGAGAVARLGIGSAGQLLWVNSGATAPAWTTPPACRVYRTTAQTLLTNTTTAIGFDAERFDTAGLHDTVTNNSRVTIAVPGVYLITGSLSFSGGAAGDFTAQLRVNGLTTIAVATEYQPASGVSLPPQFAIATAYKLAAADYVELVAAQTTGGGHDVVSSGHYTPELAVSWLGPG